MPTRLQERYRTTVHPALMQEFGYKNPMQVPRLEKIVVNIGVGEAVQDSKKADAAASDLTAITGQHPVDHESEAIDRDLQAAQGHADRLSR